MLPLKYSKFFRSGFLAKERPAKTQSTSEEPIAESSTARSRRGSILSIGSRKRRPEPVSLVLPSLPPSETSSILPIPEKKHSKLPFSSWLFDRRQMTSEDPYLSFSNAPPANRRELYDVPETVDVWITSGGPYTPKAIEKRSHEDDFFSHPLDPFDTSSDSKSVYLDLPEIRSPTPPTARQESFLSLSTPSSNLSVVNINLNVAITRKERPTSIQTMPLPALSRTSSIHRNSKSDRSRWSVVTAADTEPATATLEPLQDAADTSWQDLTHSTDWRQFHLDLLKDD